MNLQKIIVLCCIIFVIALLLYIIVKKKDEIKSYLIKLDEKITKRNKSSSNNRTEKSNTSDKEQTEEKKKSSKIKLSNKSSKDKSSIITTNKASSKEDASNKTSETNKLKPSKAVEQIRPVLLPPNREMEERDTKLLEMKQRPQMIESSPQKALDFKYGARNMGASQNLSTDSQNAIMQRPQGTTQPSRARTKINTNDFISFSKDDDNFNPLKRDVKRQFDDIKNFLELPENQTTMQQKGISYDGKNFNTVDKIDSSAFKSPESCYMNYPNFNNQPKTNSTVINSVNNAKARNNSGFQSPYTQNFINLNNSLNNTGGDVMFTKTKYARNSSTQYGMPTFNLTEREQQEASKYKEETYSLTPEQEDIDLNKLPNNLKKMIIQNILDRKDYD